MGFESAFTILNSETDKVRFAAAVVLGALVMVLFAVLTVNVLELAPLAGPFFGGLVAGYTGGKDYLSGGSAGIAAGIIGAFAVAADFVLNTGFVTGAVPHGEELAGLIIFLVVIIYVPILAFIGGALGGIWRQ